MAILQFISRKNIVQLKRNTIPFWIEELRKKLLYVLELHYIKYYKIDPHYKINYS